MRNYPSISEYEKAIKTIGSQCLNLPNSYEFVPNRLTPIKVYKVASGAFAGVFKVKDINTGKLYALRCFLNSATPQKIDRVIKISEKLQSLTAPWLCDLKVYRTGIIINQQTYPIVLMEWIDGQMLNDYVSSIISDPHKISVLQQKIVKLSHQLEELNIAHGDIQSGNILVENTSQGINLRLVDYDPMYIPELKEEIAIETGHSSFQHPKRNKSDYNETIDRFSFWLLLTALEALKYNPSLWKKDMQGGFNDEDNFLFKAKDLEQPNTSLLVSKLRSIPQKSIQFYLNELLKDTHSAKREKVSLYDNQKIEETIIIDKKEKIGENSSNKVTSLPPTPPVVENDKFLIRSLPEGAEVLIGTEVLGVTPLKLSLNLYASKIVKVRINGNEKSFYLNKNQKEYVIEITNDKKINEKPILEPIKYGFKIFYNIDIVQYLTKEEFEDNIKKGFKYKDSVHHQEQWIDIKEIPELNEIYQRYNTKKSPKSNNKGCISVHYQEQWIDIKEIPKLNEIYQRYSPKSNNKGCIITSMVAIIFLFVIIAIASSPREEQVVSTYEETYPEAETLEEDSIRAMEATQIVSALEMQTFTDIPQQYWNYSDGNFHLFVNKQEYDKRGERYVYYDLVNNKALIKIDGEFIQLPCISNGYIENAIFENNDYRLEFDLNENVPQHIVDEVTRDIPLDGAFVVAGNIKLIDLQSGQEVTKNGFGFGIS